MYSAGMEYRSVGIADERGELGSAGIISINLRVDRTPLAGIPFQLLDYGTTIFPFAVFPFAYPVDSSISERQPDHSLLPGSAFFNNTLG